jgi:uncharacterized protein
MTTITSSAFIPAPSLDAAAVARQIIATIATDISANASQVNAAVELLDGGATVPFIARYRKEATGGLDDTQLRTLDERLIYLRELAQRREAVLANIAEQGKLTQLLASKILAAASKQELEDLHLPYKQKRRTKGQIAIEAGIEPLADKLFADPSLNPQTEAEAFVLKEKTEAGDDFTTVLAVLDGVRDILSERWAQDAALVQMLREWLWQEGQFISLKTDKANENEPETAKFRDYFDYSEPVSRVPSHRALAVFRGRGLELLSASLKLPADPSLTDLEASKAANALAEGRMAKHLGWSHQARAADDLIRKAVSWAWKVKLSLSLERDLFQRLREAAEDTAIKVFAANLRDLLLAAPAGNKAVMGLDPGIRTGVKVAVVDSTGKLLDTATVYPHEPRRDWNGSLMTLAALCQKHGVALIAVGNGTASRETDKLAGEVIALLGKAEQSISKVVVSEAGASVYSASEFAAKEFPDLDVSLRGAVSIARRLQDPLAELVKIDPKSIGVGQYQHDVNQSQLAKSLDAVVEDCVNAVGVDLNTASAPLLARVSGLTPTTARSVVSWREANGAFASRADLLKVTGFGPKTFEQAAGFLRIRDGANPLDMTGVHPETYAVVERIIEKTGKPVAELMGRVDTLKTLSPQLFANEQFGIITVKDIIAELEKPGRDPRPDFVVARFNEGVEHIADLREGMVLEGTVSNVAAFGAFVDIGVHQDGLIHVSQLARKFVEDAREIVKTGQIVKVKVLEVDAPRKRISLSMLLDAPVGKAAKPEGAGSAAGHAGKGFGGGGAGGGNHRNAPRSHHESAQGNSAMADAFAKLKR